MKYKFIATTLFLGMLGLTGTTVANEPTVSKITDKYAADFNTNYIHLEPTLAKGYTKQKNVFFGLSVSNAVSNNATLKVEFINTGSSNDIIDIHEVKLLIDGEEHIYRNRSEIGKNKTIDPRSKRLSEFSKNFRIPKEILHKIVNSNTTLYEITTDTSSKGEFIHKGFIIEGNKKTKAFKSFEQTSKILNSVGQNTLNHQRKNKVEQITVNIEDGDSNITNIKVTINSLDGESSISESNIKHLVNLSKIGLNLKNPYSFKPKSIRITLDENEGKFTLNYTGENSYGSPTPGSVSKFIVKIDNRYILE